MAFQRSCHWIYIICKNQPAGQWYSQNIKWGKSNQPAAACCTRSNLLQLWTNAMMQLDHITACAIQVPHLQWSWCLTGYSFYLVYFTAGSCDAVLKQFMMKNFFGLTCILKNIVFAAGRSLCCVAAVTPFLEANGTATHDVNRVLGYTTYSFLTVPWKTYWIYQEWFPTCQRSHWLARVCPGVIKNNFILEWALAFIEFWDKFSFKNVLNCLNGAWVIR